MNVNAKAVCKPMTWPEEYCTTRARAILRRRRRGKTKKAAGPACFSEGMVSRQQLKRSVMKVIPRILCKLECES